MSARLNKAVLWVGLVAGAAAVTIDPSVSLGLPFPGAWADTPNQTDPTAPGDMVQLPAGTYKPFYSRREKKGGLDILASDTVAVKSFLLDRFPVTNGDFLAFVTTHPEWRKSTMKPIFAEAHYLEQWPSDLSLASVEDGQRPVTNVSWFAAEAYCESQGKTLPSTDQWEYALDDKGRDALAVRDRILAWYGVPNQSRLPTLHDMSPNGYGISGLIGAVWEWTLDFSTAMAGPELRSSGDKNQQLFCGGSSLGARDPNDYAAFMRYSFRVSLQASFTTPNLGFRCAKEAP